jgi:ribosome-associated toxin RatA of RatAB toxin-antitoxin module
MSKSCRYVGGVLSVAVSLASMGAFADTSGDAEWQRLAKARAAERYELAIAGVAIKAGGASVSVDAPLATVRKHVTDYGQYAAFMPRFEKSKVVAKKDGTTDVYLQVPILNGAATVWALTRFKPPQREGSAGERIEGKMIEGNVNDLRAVWHLRAVDDTHTVLKVEILIVPKLPLPGNVVTPELAFAADQAVTGMRDRAEAKASTDAGAPNRD